MKTPTSRARFQAPSRHYHRHRVENSESAWNQWVGDQPNRTHKVGPLMKGAAWVFGFLAFGGLITLMCFQMG